MAGTGVEVMQWRVHIDWNRRMEMQFLENKHLPKRGYI